MVPERRTRRATDPAGTAQRAGSPRVALEDRAPGAGG